MGADLRSQGLWKIGLWTDKDKTNGKTEDVQIMSKIFYNNNKNA